MRKNSSIDFIKLAGATIMGSVFMAGVAFAATTISTNISTGGTLSVTGASTLTGNVSAGGTLGVTGLSTLTGYISTASSTVVGAHTVTGAASLGSTLGVTGLSTLTGGFLSQASSTIVGSLTVSNAGATSTFSGGFSVPTLGLTGTATSTGTNGFNLTGGCYAINNTCVTPALGAANVWTALQTFQNAFVSQASSTVVGAFTQSNGLATFSQATTTGLHTLTGGYLSQASSTVAGAFTVSGLSTLSNASTSVLSTTGNFMVNGYATTTASNGNIDTKGALGVTGLSTLTGGYVSQASSTVVGAFTQSNGLATFSQATTTGLHTLTGGFLATASSTVVGTTTHMGPGNSAGLVLNTTVVNQFLFGTCAVNPGSIAASTTVSTNCTATGVNTGSKVFVTPKNEPNQIIFVGASSTAADTIQVSLYNTGATSGAIDPGSQTWSWFAIQ